MTSLWSWIDQRRDLLLRWLVGAPLLPHGLSKVFGFSHEVQVFTGFGFSSPQIWVAVVTAYQLLAGLLLLVGWQVRAVALSVVVFMIGTMITVNWPSGWFWNRGGIEYSVIWALLALIVAARPSASGSAGAAATHA